MKILGVTENVFQNLKDQIIPGRLAPGERFSEEELAERFGISRAPLREAYRLLENGQLVIRLPRHGTYVAELSTVNLEKLVKPGQ